MGLLRVLSWQSCGFADATPFIPAEWTLCRLQAGGSLDRQAVYLI